MYINVVRYYKLMSVLLRLLKFLMDFFWAVSNYTGLGF